MNFDKWLEREYTDCDGYHYPTKTERIVARRAWDYNGKRVAIAEREAICSEIEHERKQYKPTRYDDPEDYHYNSGAYEALDAILAMIKGD